MELRQLRAAVAVAEHRHFGRAAQALGIAQPPLSRQIAGLEAELGVQVFDRTPHGALPTPAGDVFLTHARRVLADLDAGVREARRAERGESGVLRLGFIGSALLAPLPAILTGLRAQHPGVRLDCREMSSRRATEALIGGEIDVALCRGGPSGPGAERLTAVPVVRDHVVLLCHRAHPFASRERVRWEQLRGEPLIIGSGTDEPAVFAALGRLIDDLDSSQVTYAHDVHTKTGLVACGAGIAPLPSVVASLAHHDTCVVEVDPIQRLPDMYLVHRTPPESPVLAAFLALAAELTGPRQG